MEIFHNINARDAHILIKKNSIDCVFTSPPYFRLRDYNHEDQIGLEENVNDYIDKLIEVFVNLKPLLKESAVIFVNIGDTYGNSGRGGNQNLNGKSKNKSNEVKRQRNHTKQLFGVPWKFALAMQAAGYILRQDLIWSKPNPMPESVKDRFTRSHEYIFFFTKSLKYYFNEGAAKTECAESTKIRLKQNIKNQKGSERVPNKINGPMKAVGSDMVKMRSVFNFATNKNKENHFATFPEKLVTTFLKIGCPANGIVLDPFCGSGTTNLCANKLGMNSIGIDLNDEYIKISKKRLLKCLENN